MFGICWKFLAVNLRTKIFALPIYSLTLNLRVEFWAWHMLGLQDEILWVGFALQNILKTVTHSTSTPALVQAVIITANA